MTFGHSSLARAFDANGVARALASALGGTVAIDKAQVADVRYRPGRPCWLAYRFKMRQDDGKARWQLFAARLPGVSAAIPDPPPDLVDRYRRSDHARIEPPVVRLPEFDLVLYPFPLDEAMPTLVDALDAEAVRRQLTRAWGVRRARVRKVAIRVLGYTPWARAALEYDVLAESGGLPELRRLVGKMHAMKPAARRFADAWAVWRAARGRIGLAPPAGYLGSMGVTLQDHVRGVRLGGLVNAPGFQTSVRRTARMLATLHSLSLPLATRRTAADEAATVQRWAALLALIRPDVAGRVNLLRDWISSELESRSQVIGPVHADFHHTNVLVDGDAITFIDLDEMALGDPLVDVGRFLASLRIPALRAHGRIDGLADAGDTFLETYLSRAPHDLSRARLFESASLFIAAASAFRIQRPNWVEETDLLLTEAERIAALAKVETTRPAIRRPVDRLYWMLDGTYMQAVLDPHVRAAYGEVDVTACRATLRSETSSGYRLEYDLSGWRANQRWKVRLEGVAPIEPGGRGRAASRRLTELREAFDGCPEALVLPMPVAYVSPLALLVLELPDGVPFSALAGTSDGPDAATIVARALAVLHRTPLSTPSRRTPGDELLALERDVESLRDARPDLHPLASRLAGRLAARMRHLPTRLAPTLRPAHPRHLLCDGVRVGLAEPAGLAAAHPLMDVASLLARVRLIGLHANRLPDAASTGDRLRGVALELEGVEAGELDALEGCALVRLACAEAHRVPGGHAAGELLGSAERGLGW